MRLYGIILAAIMALGMGVADAANVVNALTTDASQMRAAFLGVGMGARAVGMGEAFTAVADDPSAITWNPGGLGQMRSIEALLTYDAAGAGVGLGYGAVAVPLGPGTVGGSFTMLSFGDYPVTGLDGIQTGNASVTDTAAALGYGMPNPSWLGGRGWSGISVETISETVGSPLVGFGAGSVVPVNGQFSLGWVVQHVGPADGDFALPAFAKAGMAYVFMGRARVSFDGGYELVSREPLASLGLEAKLHPLFAFRAGYNWHGGETSPAGLTGLTVGGGIRYGAFGLDYAFQSFGELAASHRMAFLYRWKK